MGKTSIHFNVTRNISASHTGSNLLYPRVCSESIVLAVALLNSAKIKPRQHKFVFPSVTSPFILGPRSKPLGRLRLSVVVKTQNYLALTEAS